LIIEKNALVIMQNSNIVRNARKVGIFKVKVKVKQSHYRPGQALIVPGG
jgi:hypothetical protein